MTLLMQVIDSDGDDHDIKCRNSAEVNNWAMKFFSEVRDNPGTQVSITVSNLEEKED